MQLSKPLPAQSSKPLVWLSRLSCCYKIIKESEPFTNDYKTVIYFAAFGCNHPREDVRTASYSLLV